MPLFDTKAGDFPRNYPSGTLLALEHVVMRNQVQQVDGGDIGLAMLVVATAWLLIFQSGLFR